MLYDQQKKIKAKLDLARPNNKDSPTAKRQQELRAELQQIRTQQQSSKSSRAQVLDKIKRLDDRLKEQIAKQKSERGKSAFKSAEDVQREIDRLQKQVDAGTMRIVDEKKALADISQLNRQKRTFAGLDDAQRGIDALKAEISDLRQGLDDPVQRGLSDRYAAIAAELDAIKAEQDDAYKNLSALRDERSRAHEEQQRRYVGVKEIKDRYFAARRAAAEYEKEARRVREEKRRAENEAYHRGRRQEAAQAKLDEAAAPAYQEELRTAASVLAYFDPTSAAATRQQSAAVPGKFAAQATRTVDAAGIKGTVLRKKGDEGDEGNYFVGSGGKKSKQQRQYRGKAESSGGAATGAGEGGGASKFNLDMGTIDSLARLGIDPPMSQADVPALVEKLKGKIEFWKGDQERKTKEVSCLPPTLFPLLPRAHSLTSPAYTLLLNIVHFLL